MWTAFLFIALAVAMIVGPVMMLQPSHGTARVARLRTLAATRGLQVRLLSSQETRNDAARRARYILPHGNRRDRVNLASAWRLAEQREPHELHFQQRWQWVGGGRPLRNIDSDLHLLLAELPPGVSELASDDSGVSAVWDECCGEGQEAAALETICRLLLELQRIMGAGPSEPETS